MVLRAGRRRHFGKLSLRHRQAGEQRISWGLGPYSRWTLLGGGAQRVCAFRLLALAGTRAPARGPDVTVRHFKQRRLSQAHRIAVTRSGGEVR